MKTDGLQYKIKIKTGDCVSQSPEFSKTTKVSGGVNQPEKLCGCYTQYACESYCNLFG